MNKMNRESLIERRTVFLLNYKIFIIVLFLIPLYLFNNNLIKSIGYFAIGTVFILPLLSISVKNSKLKVSELWMFYFLIFAYNIILLIRKPAVGSLYQCVLQSLLLLFITLLSSMNLGESIMKKIEKYGKVLFCLILIPASVVIANGGDQAIRIFNGTFSFVMYKFMFPCTFFFFMDGKHRLMKTLIFSVIFLLLSERTIAITMVLIYLAYFFIGKLSKGKFIHITLLLCVFLGVVGFTYLYVQLQYLDLGIAINQLFRTYTGGNFFSGRNTIWETAYKYIAQAKFFGYGFNNSVMKSSGFDKSVHNTYLHILLQGGLVGLSVFYLFIMSIWKRYYRFIDNHVVRLAASYLIGILVYINFEVTLIGNTVGPGIFMWLIIGIGIIYSNNLKLKDYN